MDEALRPVIFGLVLLVVAFFVQRRTWKKRSEMGHVDPLEAVQRDAAKIDQHHRNEMNRLQNKLHDFERTIDGKIQTRFVQLEELLIQADAEIERLHQELNRLKGTSAQHGTVELTAKENSMIQHLAESGYTISEISRLTDYSETEIQASLDDSHPEAA